MTDDNLFWARLQNESAVRPNRGDLDTGAVGGNSDCWKDVHRAFVNDEYDMKSKIVRQDCCGARDAKRETSDKSFTMSRDGGKMFMF